MRLPKISMWDMDPKFDGLILFAQMMEEMVYNYSIDSYKAPFANSHSLLNELLITVEETRKRNKDINSSESVKFIRTELLHKISCDPISLKLLSFHGEENFKILRNSIKNSKNFDELIAIIEPIFIILDNERNYFTTIKKELYHTLSKKPDDTNKISVLTKLFVSELITLGYSQQYIYHITEDYFFSNSNQFKSFDQIDNYLNSFFDYFPSNETKWDIVIRGSDSFGVISKLIPESDLTISKNPPLLRTTTEIEAKFFKGTLFESKPNFPFFLVFKGISSFDYNSARQDAEAYLSSLRSSIKFTTYHLDLNWDPTMLTYSENNVVELSKPPVSSLAKIPRFKDYFRKDIKFLDPKIISKKILEDLPSLYVKLDDESKYSFYKSLTFHFAATNSENPENQFLNIWIALETLLPISNEPSIIPKFKTSYEPILSARYCEKLIKDFHGNIKFYLNDELPQLFSLLPQECDTFNDLEKCAAIIITNDPKIHQFFKEKIGRNPLFYFRLDELKNKFCNAKQIKIEIDQHKDRISWHLQRMYNTRNKITHKGEKIKNVQYLNENLNSYYHTIIDNIDMCASESEHLKTIASILIYCDIDFTTYLSILDKEKENECKNSNLKILLFGQNNFSYTGS